MSYVSSLSARSDEACVQGQRAAAIPESVKMLRSSAPGHDYGGLPLFPRANTRAAVTLSTFATDTKTPTNLHPPRRTSTLFSSPSTACLLMEGVPPSTSKNHPFLPRLYSPHLTPPYHPSHLHLLDDIISTSSRPRESLDQLLFSISRVSPNSLPQPT